MRKDQWRTEFKEDQQGFSSKEDCLMCSGAKVCSNKCYFKYGDVKDLMRRMAQEDLLEKVEEIVKLYLDKEVILKRIQELKEQIPVFKLSDMIYEDGTPVPKA